MVIARHQRMMLNGWNIPHVMEWLFWPMGYKLPEPHEFAAAEGATVKFEGTVTVSGVIQRSLVGRFKLTNHKAFMAQLLRLGVVKEQR